MVRIILNIHIYCYLCLKIYCEDNLQFCLKIQNEAQRPRALFQAICSEILEIFGQYPTSLQDVPQKVAFRALSKNLLKIIILKYILLIIQSNFLGDTLYITRN